MREASALKRTLERAGFTLVRTTKHHIWRCPCGHVQITAPATPGKGRCIQNMNAEIARALRACRTEARVA